MEGFFWQRSVLVFYTTSLQGWRWTDERTQIFNWGITVPDVLTEKRTIVTSLCCWSQSRVGEMVSLRPGLNCGWAFHRARHLSSSWHLPCEEGSVLVPGSMSAFVLKCRVPGRCCSPQLLGKWNPVLAVTASLGCCILEVCLCESTEAIKRLLPYWVKPHGVIKHGLPGNSSSWALSCCIVMDEDDISCLLLLLTSKRLQMKAYGEYYGFLYEFSRFNHLLKCPFISLYFNSP